MSVPGWWKELAAEAEAAGHERYSAAWYAAFRDLHLARFPDSDQRTKANLRDMAASAAAREGVLYFGDVS